MRQFYQLKDVNDVDALVKRALEIKAKKASGSASTNNNYSKGKTIVLLFFFNPSLRTRLKH
ncbi:MAG: hypothetical protein R2788_03890 [Saprospiraceae bacterium]